MESIIQKDSNQFVDRLIQIWTPANVEPVGGSTGDDAKSNTALMEIKEFLSKSLNLVNAKISAEAKKVVIDITDDQKGDLLREFADIQMLEPRGRFKVQITTTCLMLEGKSGSALIPHDEIVNIALLPSHTSAKKEGEDYLVLTFDHPLKVCGKDSKHVLFNLSKTLPKGSESAETESMKFVEAIKEGSQMKINQPNPNIFRSIANQKTPHFLRCHKGTQEGAIYPLYCGIYFIKPTLFVHADEIASISAGRGGSSGNTRFVDLQIETTDDKSLEFGNIDREELPAIQGYIRGYLEVRRKKQEEKKSGGPIPVSGQQDDNDDDDDDDDDDDYDPNKSDDDSDCKDSGNSDSGSDSDSDVDQKQKKSTVISSNKKRSLDEKSSDNHRKKSSKAENIKDEVVIVD